MWQSFLLFASVLTIVFAADCIRAQSFLNVRVSDSSLGDPEEVSIAINPKNTSQLAAGANSNYFFSSSDGGLGWNWEYINSQYGVWGDPCLLYDDSGILYYEHLATLPFSLANITVQRSTDFGANFDLGEGIGYDSTSQQDKAWLTLDRSGTSSNGSIMTSWTEDDHYGSRDSSDSSRIYFSESPDHGLTWSKRVRVDHWAGDCVDAGNTDEGAVTTTGPDGSIYIVWAAHHEIYFNYSNDGGKSFGQERPIVDQPGGWNFTINGLYRANGLPMIACDQNPQSQFYRRLYIMWSDQRREGFTDVYSIYSTDNGLSWSAIKKVNTDTAQNDHFFPEHGY